MATSVRFRAICVIQTPLGDALNRALRRALRDPERSGKQPDENPDMKEPARP